MCGIAGFISHPPLSDEGAASMSSALAHRGPDAHGIWREDAVCLVHRRLSILDVEQGVQPMVSEDGQVVVVFNGEIYNYPELRRQLETEGVRFRTHCDTEVLPILYQKHGVSFVSRLHGMFALAIWDRRHRRLLLARDRIGQKPLFYSQNGRGFGFASEAKALFASGLVKQEMSLDGLWHHASLRFCPGEQTLYSNVKKLEPGTTLVLDDVESPPKTERYWNLVYTRKSSLDFDAAIEELDSLLRGVVKAHLLSDVPLGAFLSGGIDSSLISAMAARDSAGTFPTFSIGVTESDFTELPAARTVADAIGSEHHEFKVKADLMLLLPEIIWHLEEPGDPHAVGIYLLSRLARQHVKVALSGDGGDEAFAGYARYTRTPVVDMLALVPRFLRRSLVAPVIARLPDSYSYYSLASKARWVYEMSMREGADRHYTAFTFFRFSEAQREHLFTETARRGVEQPQTSRWFEKNFYSEHVSDDVDRMLYTEQMVRLPEHDLRIGDRMSMAHGLELRPPLVDHRILEFAASLPSEFKMRNGQLKAVLRQLSRRYIPREVVERRKYGFGFPMARWFRGPLKNFASEVIRQSSLFATGLLDRSYAEHLLEMHVDRGRDHNFRLWSLINMEVWYRLFICGHSREQVRGWLSELLGKSEPAAD